MTWFLFFIQVFMLASFAILVQIYLFFNGFFHLYVPPHQLYSLFNCLYFFIASFVSSYVSPTTLLNPSLFTPPFFLIRLNQMFSICFMHNFKALNIVIFCYFPLVTSTHLLSPLTFTKPKSLNFSSIVLNNFIS